MMSSPIFIVLEGIDGSGKTTAISKIGEYLESLGRKVMITKEPTKGAIGKLVAETDDLTPESEALLFTADRACHTKEISECLEAGYDVICDRYFASTLAYQSASGLDRDWLYSINSKVIREPDVHILLDVDPEISLTRVGKRGEKVSRFEKLDYLRKVRDSYLGIAKAYGLTVLDASRNEGDVLMDIIGMIDRRI